nr:ribonuclease H-like domain-containing protein [Tanacetum cinerariifolium]
MTRRVLLCCDSNGALYPVMKPSAIPHAFLIIQYTWHQRLGHPGKDHTLSRYKARPVENGITQLDGVDVDETFSSVVKPDPGSLNYLLDISVTRDSSGMFLSQRKYVAKILERAHMVNYNPSRNHVDTEFKLGDDGYQVSDPILYQSLASSLQYLTFTRPHISYAVQQVCLYMHDPREPHFSALKRILRYVRGYCIFLGNNLLFWSSTRQPMLSRSSAEAEYRGVANVVAETCWLRNLLRELHTPLSSATLVYSDYVRVLHVPSRYQYADILTKGLPSTLFEEFRTSLSVWCLPAQTARVC